MIEHKYAFRLTLAVLMLSGLGTQSWAQQPASEIPESAFQAAHNAITDFGKRAGAPDSRVHIMPTPQARATLPASVLNRNNFHDFDLNAYKLLNPHEFNKSDLQPHERGAAFPAPTNWSPADLTFFGGMMLAATTHHPIYVNCKTGTTFDDHCWVTSAGDIGKFINKLNASKFITITNQYVGSTATNRYPLGKAFGKSFTAHTVAGFTNKVMFDADAQAIALAAAKIGGAGYGHMYHIFVPPNMDVCFNSFATTCYSPDNPAFAFCGYHSSFTSGGLHVVYSVEPYDNVSTGNGSCMATGMSKTDAQVSVLSHEIVEAITDPDPNTGWFNKYSLRGGEIGDECAWQIYAVALGTTAYNIQLEYSNKSHACSGLP